jgi:Leucine-rich repeat (LRR) protein
MQMIGKNKMNISKFLIMNFILLVLLILPSNGMFSKEPNSNRIELITSNDSLICINLEDNGEDFPYYLFQFKHLKKLHILHCYYRNIPDEIKTLEDLELLRIKECYWMDYKDLFSKLKFNSKFSSLVLCDDSLEYIPDNIDNLTKLDDVNFQFNQLKSLPNKLFKISTLKSLELGYNQIDSFGIGSDTNYQITYLSLNNNHLKKIPIGLEKLQGLNSIYLDNNDSLSLRDICSLVSKLPNLKLLSIRNIGKKTGDILPDNISSLKKENLCITITGNDYDDAQIEQMKKLGLIIVYYDK